MIILETERLLHRRITSDDLETIIEFRSDDEVSKYLGGERAKTREFNEKRMRFYLDCWKKNGYGFSMMIWKETGEEIGWSGLQPLEETGLTEVGYGLIKKFWRRGIGLETAKAWLEFGFTKAGLERIVALAVPENVGSWRIMEKLGMHYEKTEEHYGLKCLLYSITKEEFLK